MALYQIIVFIGYWYVADEAHSLHSAQTKTKYLTEKGHRATYKPKGADDDQRHLMHLPIPTRKSA